MWKETWIVLAAAAAHHKSILLVYLCMYGCSMLIVLEIQQMSTTPTLVYWIMNLKLSAVRLHSFIKSPPSRLWFWLWLDSELDSTLHYCINTFCSIATWSRCSFINFMKYNIKAACITVIYSLVVIALMLILVCVYILPSERQRARVSFGSIFTMVNSKRQLFCSVISMPISCACVFFICSRNNVVAQSSYSRYGRMVNNILDFIISRVFILHLLFASVPLAMLLESKQTLNVLVLFAQFMLHSSTNDDVHPLLLELLPVATAFAVADEETTSFNIYKGRKISFAHLAMFALKSSDYPSFMDGLPTQSIRRLF